MKFHQRVAAVIASEGFKGVLKRILRRISSKKRILQETDFDAEKTTENYNKLKRDFYQKIKSVDFPGIEDFLWYHTIDLGNGLITPGDYDYRGVLRRWDFLKI